MTPDHAEHGRTPSKKSPRDPGDAWVEGGPGERYWGRFGAAGLLAVDQGRGILLQHRALWSHHGGTWGLPGGALHEGEASVEAALREAQEEAGVPAHAVRPRALWVLDKDVWTYTTVVADVLEPFAPVAGDAESMELRWVPVGEVEELPLHPGFEAAWPVLRGHLGVRPHLLIDAANVVGSVPDGWWRDRRGATERLHARLSPLANAGLPAAALGFEGSRWFPIVEVVVEGNARGAQAPESITVTEAVGSGDDAIVARVEQLSSRGEAPIVVTSDRALSDRVVLGGASAHGAGWLLGLLDESER